MAITILDLPKSTQYALLKETAGRKERIKSFIDGLATKYPTAKGEIDAKWTEKKAVYDKLTGTSSYDDFKHFFNFFDGEQKIIDLIKPEHIKQLGDLLTEKPTDSDLIKELKATARDKASEIPDYYDNADGGITWGEFLIDLIGNYYLKDAPASIDKKLTDNSILLSELDKTKWDKLRGDFFNNVYSTFNNDQEESDLEPLIKGINDSTSNIKDLIVETRQTKESYLKDENVKLWKFCNKLTSQLEYIYSNYPEILYGTSTSSSSSGNTTPSSDTTGQTTPDNSRPPTPDNNKPKPEPKPDNSTKPPSPEEIAAKELQALKDEIGKLPLNSDEKSALTNAKKKEEAEIVRTKYNARVNKAQAEKDEVAKYDKILADIKTETDQTKLEDGKDYDSRIKGLVVDLLAGKNLDTLQTERKNKWQELETERIRVQLQNAKTDALIKDDENNNWDPVLDSVETDLINGAKDLQELSKYQNQIRTKRENIKKAVDLLDQINTCEDITNLPSMATIRNTYDDSFAPPNLKYDKMKEARNATRLKLFKGRFNTPTDTGLSEEEIAKWRDSLKETGLDGLGIEERTAFLNKWKVEEIKDRKVLVYEIKAETTEKAQDIDPLKVNKDILDNALKMLASINDPAKQTFKSLPENYKAEEIGKLPTDLPGHANLTYLIARIKERRETFSLSLDQPDDDGLTPELLIKARGLETGVYVAKGKPPAPASVLNEILRYEMTKDRTPVKKLEWSEPQDLDGWLTSPENKGYRIEDEKAQDIKGKLWEGKDILEQENDKWGNPEHVEYDRGKQGRLLLPFFNKKVGFDPDNPEAFLSEAGNDIKGCLPFATGIGKTTKTVCCLCKGGGRSMILVLPTESLALSAAGSHNDWLQDYICPIHEVKHGEYPVGLFEIIENGLSILRPGDLLGYMVRNLLKFGKTGGIIGVNKSPSDAEFEEKVKIVREGRKLKKDKHIILFDEADETNPTYQAIMEEAINQGYKCIKMSATFPGVPWSITTTNKIKGQLITGLKDDMLVANDGEPKNILIFIRETEPITKGKETIDPLTPEQKKALEPYSYVVFDKSNAGSAEGISRGMPRGTIFFVSPIYGRGFTFFIQATILTNWGQTKKLGGGWIYGEPNTQRLTLADQGQERGRVGRTEAGDAWWLNNELGQVKEEKGKESVGTKLAKAVLTGDLTELQKTYGTLTKAGIDFLRAAIAWPDKFGLLPEEILIGVQVGGAAKNIFPSFPEKPPMSYDADLWDRHRRIVKKSTMPKDTAVEILKLMIANLVKRKTKENNFPDNIKVKIESPLIEQVGWTEDAKKNKGNIQEVREVVNGVIAENIPDPAQDKFKDEKLFNKIVKLHKISLDLKISIEREETDEWVDKKDKTKGKKKKDNLTLLITSGDLKSARNLKNIGDFYSDRNERMAEKL